MARFPVVLRGYERTQVDALIARIEGTLAEGTPAKGTPAESTPAEGTPAKGTPAEGARGTGGSDVRGHSVPISADEVRGTRFHVVLRGYDPRAVDEVLQEHIRRLAAADRRSRSRQRQRRPAMGTRWLIDWIENVQFGSSGLRAGYDVRDVDAFLERVVRGLRGSAAPVDAGDVRESRFRTVRFGPGYAEEEVDRFLEQLAAAFDGGSPHE